MNKALPMTYLVRHADTVWTLTGQHTGRTNLPLTEEGERQARELGASLTALRIDRMLSSPLQRDGCPGGETLESVGTRADRVIDRIRAEGGTVLLFGHREVLRILAVRWIGLAPIEGRRLLLATASLSVLATCQSLWLDNITHALLTSGTLADRGAGPRRWLWASTGTKDPTVRDTLYVEALAAPDTINITWNELILGIASKRELS